MATTGSGPKTVLEYTTDPNFTGGGKNGTKELKPISSYIGIITLNIFT
jgi:hypothetical protein